MPLDKGKHTVEEINGVRCSVVEKGVTAERLAFIREILEFNKLEVQAQEEKRESEDAPVTYTVGVTDLLFNIVIAIYQVRVKLKDGRIASPAYWNQWTEKVDNKYWRYRRKGTVTIEVPDTFE
jgi:hypothetical protein